MNPEEEKERLRSSNNPVSVPELSYCYYSAWEGFAEKEGSIKCNRAYPPCKFSSA